MKALRCLLLMAALAAPLAHADEVILDDLIVTQSACVGPSCVVDQEFGFDTLALQGDELRLGFIDTSSSSSFPTNDWQITINDLDSGSESHFSIEDLDAGTVPFSIEAGSPSNAIYIKDDGRVGINTTNPDPDSALDVNGNLRVDGTITSTSGPVGLTGVKAGIVSKRDFKKGKATVTFQTAYASDYTLQLTPVGKKNGKFSPSILKRDASGFKLWAGANKLGDLIEIHWVAQPVGE